MILDNPFRQLGLAATASAREVRRSLEETRVELEMGADEDAVSDLSRLRQQLDDPVQRVHHEVFWVHAESVVIDVTDGPAVAGTTAILREVADNPPSREQAIALHDLAVLSYAHYLACDNGSDPSEILGLWADVAVAGEFWLHLEQRALAARDSRITPDLVEEIRAGLPAAILDPIAAKAARLIDAGDLEGAAAIVRAIRGSALPTDAIEVAVNAVVAPIRASADDGVAAVSQQLDEIRLTEGTGWDRRQILTAIETDLVERVLAPLERLRAVDAAYADPGIGDRAAQVTRRLAVMVCNGLEAWEWGFVLLRHALSEARSPGLIAQLAAEQAQVAMSYHGDAAVQTAEDGSPVGSAAHAELALTYASTDEDRASWRDLANRARRQRGLMSPSELAERRRWITSDLERHYETLRGRVQRAAGRAQTPPAAPAPLAAVPVAPSTRSGSWRTAVIVLIVLIVVLIVAAAAFGAGAGVAAAGAFAVALPTQPRGARFP